MIRSILLITLLITQHCTLSQDTVVVKSIDEAILKAKEGNYLHLVIYNDTSEHFPKEFKNIPTDKLLSLVFDNCNYKSFPLYLGEYKNLIELEYLWYYGLDLVPIKEIPEFIFKLTNLESLKFERVKLSKISPEISSLKNLRALSLYCCRLEEFPWEILAMEKLEKLDLSCNNFTMIPQEIVKLKKLNYLNFDGGGCGSTPIDSIPGNIGELQELQYFGLGYTKNPIRILPKSFYQLKNLKSFNCNGCGLESLSDDIINLKNLSSLTLTNLDHFDAFPASFFSLSNLQYFRFYASDIQTKDLLLQKKRVDDWGLDIKNYNFKLDTQDENLFEFITY